jgi:hypothetical protein
MRQGPLRGRPAFTPVELLAILAILAGLIGFLLPAVRMARSTISPVQSRSTTVVRSQRAMGAEPSARADDGVTWRHLCPKREELSQVLSEDLAD